jgi:hypothetical protein
MRTTRAPLTRRPRRKARSPPPEPRRDSRKATTQARAARVADWRRRPGQLERKERKKERAGEASPPPGHRLITRAEKARLLAEREARRAARAQARAEREGRLAATAEADRDGPGASRTTF